VPALPDSVGSVMVTGDRKAVDPCALLDTEVLAQFGQIRVGPGFSFGGCQAVISAGKASFNLQFLLPSAGHYTSDRKAPAVIGGITVNWMSAVVSGDKEYCDAAVELTDGTQIYLQAYGPTTSSEAGYDMCAIVDTGTVGVVRLLKSKGITYAPGRLESSPLASVDACELIDPNAVAAAVPDIDVADRQPEWGNWGCGLGTPDKGRPSVHYTFQFGDPADVGASATIFDGYPGFMESEGKGMYNDTSCGAVVEYRQRSSAAPARNEIAIVRVEGPDAYATLCEQALALVSTMVSKLPR